MAASVAAVSLWQKTRAHDIEHASQLEREIGLPVHVCVPYSRQQERLVAGSKRAARRPQHPLAIAFPLDAAVESLRQFRATLQFALPQHGNNIVLFTSAEAGSGKSFIAANLAVLFGACKRKVLLIDADLRHGSLGAHVESGKEEGLSETLAGLQSKEALIAREVFPGVDFIAAGSLRGDSSELLQRPEFVECLEAASRYYDVVLVNCAPVLEASDSLVLGRHAGAIYLVARSGRSGSRQLGEAVRRFRQVGLSPKGFVLNGERTAEGYVQSAARYAGHWQVQYRPWRKQLKAADARHAGKIPRA
jgi:tyrosine-protein kinase Etk/Wzc